MKTRHFLLIVILASFQPLLASDNDLPLNTGWQFLADSVADYRNGLPAEAVSVTLPHTWNVMEGLEDYAGRAWYERLLDVPAEWRGQQLWLCFGAVYHDATVYVNGQLVGQHLNAGYSPFRFEISRFVRYGEQNRLVVMADNSYSEQNLPFRRSFDWANDGGIYREVSLHLTGRQSIRYAHFTPSLNTQDSTGIVRVNIRLHEQKVQKATFRITISDKQTGREIYSGQQPLRRQKDGTFSCLIDCVKVKPWHFDQPNLYSYQVELFDGQSLSDADSGHFGFRTFTIEDNRFVLNGEKIRLPGIEMMPGSHPDFGMAESKSYIRQSAAMLKDLNAVMTRFHWGQDEAMYDAMDSLGILVQEELSWWQQPYKSLSPELRESARRQLSELIEAHYNHPCIYGWGLSNEVRDNHQEIQALASEVRRLDPTRLFDVVCNHTDTNLAKDPSLVLDLPTWNDYVGTWNGHRREDLLDRLDAIRQVLDGRPLFITEAGLCEPAHAGGDRRRMDDMLYHIGEWQKTDFICGYIYFCLNDYRTQMGEEGYGRHRIRRHGITDCRLQPKPSYYLLRDLMSPVEITNVKASDAGAVSDQEHAGSTSHDILVELRVKHSIPSYVLRGYSIVYQSDSNTEVRLSLPELLPGESYQFSLKGINSSYHFKVTRPNGTMVAEY